MSISLKDQVKVLKSQVNLLPDGSKKLYCLSLLIDCGLSTDDSIISEKIKQVDYALNDRQIKDFFAELDD